MRTAVSPVLATLSVNWLAPTLELLAFTNSSALRITITGASNLVLVIEACTNLATPTWQTVLTNTLVAPRWSSAIPGPLSSHPLLSRCARAEDYRATRKWSARRAGGGCR